MRVVIPSVNYADFLSVTLPAWKRVLKDATIRVVTTRDDEETKRVARENGAKLCVTDIFRREGKFNKAAALDRAFGFVGHDAPPELGEACLALDADVYPCGVFPAEDALQLETLYGCPRMHCDTPNELHAHLSGRTRLAQLHLMPPLVRGEAQAGAMPYSPQAARAAAMRCLGYFQLFRYHEGLRFGSSRTAGGYDLRFRVNFAERVALTAFYVMHLGERSRANWSGRVVKEWGAA